MAESIVINAETREITVPEAERAFGVAGERRVEVKHIRIEGRTVDGTDLTQGFAWKVSCENAGKELCADLIDSIVADADSIEFDWVVGAAPMAYKGTMHFAICAVRVDAAGNVLQEWHSHMGAGDVANGIEATVQNIGGQELLAYVQSMSETVRQNMAAAQNSAAAAAKSASAAKDSQNAAANSAKAASDNAQAAANSAKAASDSAQAAGEAAKKVIDEGIADKLSEMQSIQDDVTTKKSHIDTAAETATKARDDAQAAQQASADSAAAAEADRQTTARLAEQAKAAATQAQGYAGAATFSIGYDADGMLSLFMEA